MKEDINKIILDGTLAPSGENCQPWKFVVKGNEIRVYNIPEADQSLYNSKQKGSYVSHGALIENVVISASHHGYANNVEVFPDSQDDPNFVSRISLEPATKKNELLYPYIGKRCTNRKDYTGAKLSDQQKSELIDSATTSGACGLSLIDDSYSLDRLGKALAVNEKIIFENKNLHKFFYDHIIWEEENQNKSGGFYVDTLEFLPHQLKGIKIFKIWVLLNILNKFLGVSGKIVKENAEKYAESGTLGAILAKGNTKEDFVEAGRVAQRVWLTAAKMGLSIQPCTGVLYLMEKINDGNSSCFSMNHSQMIKDACNDITSTFDAEGKTIPMLFRIGFSSPPTARSMRMEPNILEYDKEEE